MYPEKNLIYSEISQLKKQSENRAFNNFTISINDVKKIAGENHFSEKYIDIIALEKKIIPERYQRNIGSITNDEQIKLLKSSVAIIGCGGLGGNVIQLLTRMGIGELSIVDGDQFNNSNINRQIFCEEKNIGKPKVDVAAEWIKRINSSLNVKKYQFYIDSKNISGIISGADVVVDALDNINSRFVLERACRDANIPLVHAAVDGFSGQVSVIFPKDKGLELIYGSIHLNNNIRKKWISVPAVTPALIASFQVQETIKILLKKGEILRNKLLYINLEEMDIEVINLE